jgi:hypothetical protein
VREILDLDHGEERLLATSLTESRLRVKSYT